MKHGKIKLITSLLAVSLSSFATAAVENGNFEQWSGNTPAGWQTIDSGIAISSTSTYSKSGQYAAAVSVNTSTQGNTDLQQSVAVTSGQSYEFSTWVYHTEGGVRARLVVDGYQNYSDPTLTNQWQKISYSYTASESTNIAVGLRFYDVSGFDGSELVYVDDFQPASGTTTPPPPSGCTSNSLSLSITTDQYGSETSWQVTNANGSVVDSGNGYGANQSVNESLCLTDGDYTLSVFDSYGDGMCCSYGNGQYALTFNGNTLASGGQFSSRADHSFTLGSTTTPPPVDGYYATANGLTGYALKTELHNIIRNHNSQGYSAIWGFIDQYERDRHFDKDGSILDRYSEKPTTRDSVNYTSTTSQCGSYSGEGDCYNREHSFPKSWFGGKREPMNSDIHHIFASDGYVNTRRNSFPFGEVGSATYTSSNGSKLGSASGIGYSGTVFEPIDEFKGDFARAYFYMATRYQDVIAGWENYTSNGDAVLNGTSNQVFEPWVIALLKRWHQQDPVDATEKARNQGAYEYQGNRNPYIDHPEFVEAIW
ncbi:endonuclease [Pseudoalteromonas sp. T1lg65]|uniref:endonuclease n=1 Tax=Pseudoalteromonas sp. T1lg65 TaxID=2077101 RepID=UPI003F7A1042